MGESRQYYENAAAVGRQLRRVAAPLPNATPADAALLRLLADCYRGSGTEPTDEQLEQLDRDLTSGVCSARLRALADVLEAPDRNTVLARCYGFRSALGPNHAEEGLCEQRECVRCWRKRYEAATAPACPPSVDAGDRPGGGGVGEQR